MARDTDRKRSGILDAAITCFQRVGFAKARISDIATEAAIGKGTVYEYYRSKEELLLDACVRACNRNEERMEELLGGPMDQMSAGIDAGIHPVKAAHQVLHTVLTVLLATSREEQRLFSELVNLTDSQPELAARARSEMGTRLAGWIEQATTLYEAGRRSGHFRDIPDPQGAARLIVATVDGLIWQQHWTDETPTELARQIADAWMHLHLAEPHRLPEYLA